MRKNRRNGRRAARLSLLALGIVSLIVLPAPSALAHCPLLDPQCLLGTVDEVVGDATGVVEDTVQGVTNVVEDVPEVLEHTLEVASGGKEEADKAPEPVSEILEAAGSSDEPAPSPVGGNRDGEQVEGTRSDRRARTAVPAGQAGTPTVVLESSAEGSASVSTARPGPSVLPPDAPGILDRIGTAAADAARQLRFPVALSLIVLAFVLFQNNLDRKDPKLALAPITAEVMRFE